MLDRLVPYLVGGFEFGENVVDAARRALRRAARGGGAPSPRPPPLDMDGERVVITGGNAGLGEALAVEGETALGGGKEEGDDTAASLC